MGVLIMSLTMLAVYRLATDIAWTRGPGDGYEWLRSWAAQRWGVQSWQADGINCPICVSFWLSLPAALIVVVLLDWPAPIWPLIWLGIAGGAAWLIRAQEGSMS
jgi:hypothetical protein